MRPPVTAMASGTTVRKIAAGLVLAGLCLFAFGGALLCGFVHFDDDVYVFGNTQVAQGLTVEGLRWAFTTGHAANWHPLTWISHMADVELYGLEPAGHHATSLLLHALNGILLFLVLGRLTGRFYPSLWVAALWVVHPLRVESVVWISERKDVLSMFFGLLALWAYVRPAVRGRMGWVALGFTLSLMSKPLWVTLPFLLLLLDVWPLKRWPKEYARALIREKWPLFLLAACSCVITYWVQQASGAVLGFERYPLDVRLANSAVAYVEYLRVLFWPFHLAVFYPHPRAGISAGQGWGALVVLSALTAWALLSARRRPWWTVGWLWFLGTLVPMIGWVQVGDQAWADRYSYLPHIGLLLALVWGGTEVVDRWVGTPRRGVRQNKETDLSARGPYLHTFSAVLVLGLVVWLALLSRRQTLVWCNDETLFRHALAVRADNNAPAHFHLANLLLQAGRMEEAIGHYQAVLMIFPENLDALRSLAHAQELAGDEAGALDTYAAIIQLYPENVDARNRAAVILVKQGHVGPALEQWGASLKINPAQPEVLNRLGTVAMQEGQKEKAASYWRQALEFAPGEPNLLRNLAAAEGGGGQGSGFGVQGPK